MKATIEAMALRIAARLKTAMFGSLWSRINDQLNAHLEDVLKEATDDLFMRQSKAIGGAGNILEAFGEIRGSNGDGFRVKISLEGDFHVRGTIYYAKDMRDRDRAEMVKFEWDSFTSPSNAARKLVTAGKQARAIVGVV